MKENQVRSRPRDARQEDDGLLRHTKAKNLSPASIPAEEADNLQEDDPEQALGRSAGGRDMPSVLDEDNLILEIKSACFYRRSVLKELLFALLCVITGGVAIIVSFWYPRAYARLRFWKVKQNDCAAEDVLVESFDGIVALVQIQWIIKKGGLEGWMPASKARFLSDELTNRDRMFVWREERFWYNDKEGSWNRRAFDVEVTYAELHSTAHDCAVKEIGHESNESQKSDSRKKRSLAYGSNQLTVDIPNFGCLLVKEVFRPFFIFQVFSIAVWMYQDYRIYAYVILSMTVLAILFNVLETHRSLLAVKKLAASECEVRRLTLPAETGCFKPVVVSSSELLPGDIVEIEAGMVFPCDLVLLAGECVVNESTLTGESAPVPKRPLPSGPSASAQVFQTKSELGGRHMLLSGTQAVQIRGSCDPRLANHAYDDSDRSDQHPSIWQFLVPLPSQIGHSAIIKYLRELVVDQEEDETRPVAAMVVATAYSTAKGQLVRAIRFPKPSKYNFEKKLYCFIGNSAVYLLFVCALTVYFQAGKESASAILLRCINLATIAVPAALPVALSIGVSLSFKRLQGKGVCCINPSRIVSAGRVDTLCFDKTGTITEDGLNLKGVVPVLESEDHSCNKRRMRCGQLQEDPHAIYLQGQQALAAVPEGNLADKTSVSSLGLFYTLAACHSISILDHVETGSCMAGEDGSKDQIGIRETGRWYQRFCRTTYRHSKAKYSETSSEQERADVQKRCQFIGDPLEIQMFTSTGWRYITHPFDELLRSVNRPNPPTIWMDVLKVVDTVIMAPNEEDSKPLLVILRRLDFDSEIRLMSSIVLELPARDSKIDCTRSWILVKGAPESLQELCVPESLPLEFTSQLQDFALKGYRVLACAYRLLESMTMSEMQAARRQEMEKELTFCGFLIMENKLKPETSNVLLQLAKAEFRQVMVTGDNPVTAFALARQCGRFFLKPACGTYLIDRATDLSPERHKSNCVLKNIYTDGELDVDVVLLPQVPLVNSAASTVGESSPRMEGDVNLVVTGRAFAALILQHDHLRELFMERTRSIHVKATDCVTPLQMILTQANIFSRMSPQHKLELMQKLQDLGYVVCMTGDGANDSGALKAADVGISISSKPVYSKNTVADGPSIAAPFSTKLAHIGAVSMILAEGRCALVSATVMFKYMFLYAIIQATSVLVLYRLQLELYDYQYLWADLALVFPLLTFMPATPPREELTCGKPIDDLLATPILTSVYGHSVFIILFQVLAQVYLQHQSWYVKPNDQNSAVFSSKHNYNSTVSFLFASFQYVGLAMTLSQSFGAFRKSPSSNVPLMATLICQFIISSIFLLKPMQLAVDAFSLVDSSEHRIFLFGLWMLAIGNSVVFVLFERYAVSHQSTEHDMPAALHQETEGELPSQTRSTLLRAVEWKGDENFFRPRRPVKKDFLKVAEVASSVWSRISYM